MPVLTRHGKVEPAFHILSRCVNGNDVPHYDWLVLDPELEPLRANARFQEILTLSRKQFEEVVRVLDEARERRELPAFLEPARTNLVKKLGIA